jgi:hypothetical protein
MARSERVILARGDGKTLHQVRQQFKRGRWTYVRGTDGREGEVLVDTLQVRAEQLTARVEWEERPTREVFPLPPQDEQMAIEQGLDAALEATSAVGHGPTSEEEPNAE